MLVPRVPLDTDQTAAEFPHQRRACLLAVGLTKLRGIDADEANLPGPALGIGAGDGVTVVDCLNPPLGPTRVVEPGTHRHDDRGCGRCYRGDQQVGGPEPWR